VRSCAGPASSPCSTPFTWTSKRSLSWSAQRVCGLLGIPLLPSRVPQPIRKDRPLDGISYFFLGCNQIVDLTFTQNLAHLLWTTPDIVWGWQHVTLSNTVVAFAALFLIDDFFYYWAHRWMHHPLFYKHVHKHHHRQVLPKRGYSDGINVHPLEAIIGLGLVWTTLYIVRVSLGLHFVTASIFFTIYALCAILNHTPYDVRVWPLFGSACSLQVNPEP